MVTYGYKAWNIEVPVNYQLFGTIEVLMKTIGGTSRNPLFMKHHLFSSDEGIQGMLMEGCCQEFTLFTPPLRAMAQSDVTTGFMTRRPWHKKLRLWRDLRCVAQWPAAYLEISNVLPHVAVHPSDPWVLTGFGESCEGRSKRWSQLGRNQINQGQNSFEMDPPVPFPSISSRKWGN